MKRVNRCSRYVRGFTLLETIIGVGILTLILVGFTSLLMSSMRYGSTVMNQSCTSLDAATAIQKITMALREARRFQLMEDGNYGTTYLATDSNSNVVAVTGIHIVYPATMSSNVSVVAPSGATLALSGSNALMDIKTDGPTLDIYRSDSSGNPAPSNGTYLWAKGTISGMTLPDGGTPLVRNIAKWVGAVQFIQPCAPGSSTPLPNQVQIKLTTGAWDMAQGQVTSDSTRGNVISLTGQHVFLRNHDPNGVTSVTNHGKVQYTGN